MTASGTISIQDLLDSSQQRQLRVPAEVGAFIALQVCEEVVFNPVRFSAAQVLITQEGAVMLQPALPSAVPEEACQSVVGLLSSLLVAAGTGVPASLLSIVEGAGPIPNLNDLRQRIEASLVPLNRSAARRVVGRLVRDVKRVSASSAPVPPGVVRPRASATPAALDEDLDSLLAMAPAAAPARPQQRLAPAPPADTWDERPTTPQPQLPRDPWLTVRESQPAPPSKSFNGVATPPSRSSPATHDSPWPGAAGLDDALADIDAGATGGTSRLPYVILALVALAGLALGGLAVARPQMLRAIVGDSASAAPERVDDAAPVESSATSGGRLIVRADPDRAQILLYVGTGPLEVANVAQGLAHEFVAVGPDGGWGRALLPATAEWSGGAGASRYELAIQLQPLEAAAGRLGQSLIAEQRANLGSATGKLGTVRVVTNPPRSRVYMLIGFAPTAQVDNVARDAPVELMVYHPAHGLERATVSPDEWIPRDGTYVAEVSLSVEVSDLANSLAP